MTYLTTIPPLGGCSEQACERWHQATRQSPAFPRHSTGAVSILHWLDQKKTPSSCQA